MKVLIAGGGIGGLTAALCLLQAGHEVELFEQTPMLNEVGAGVQCGANAVRVLDHLGLLDQLQALAVEPKRIEFCDYRSGEVLHSMKLGAEYLEQYGAPYLHLYRADLHSILAEQLMTRCESALHLNTKVAGYTETSSGVQLQLANGELISGDCLVAADGVRSVIRDQLLDKKAPQNSGMVAWRGVVPVEQLSGPWMDRIARNFVGPDKHVVLYYLRNQRLANFVGVVETPISSESSWVNTAPWSDLKADFEGWHNDVQTIIDAMDKQQCYRWSLFKHKPFENWSSDRVTLLGDAAHPTLPFMAAGASMAIEDARVLERCLTSSKDTAAALQRYQRNRMQRTGKIQTTSDKMGALYHLNSSFLRRAAFTSVRLFGSKTQSFLPDYDANSIELI